MELTGSARHCHVLADRRQLSVTGTSAPCSAGSSSCSRLGGKRRSLHMRFHLGDIPSSPDFVPDASWKPLRQPSPWMALLAAYPIGIVAAGMVTVLWLAITPFQLQDVTSTMSLRGFLVSFAGMAFPRADPSGCPPDVRTVAAFDCGCGRADDGSLRPLRRRDDTQPLCRHPPHASDDHQLCSPACAAVAQVSSGWLAFIPPSTLLWLAQYSHAVWFCFQIRLPRRSLSGLEIYWREHDTLAA
jgi:hypothetical protein